MASDTVPANMATLSSKPASRYSVSDWATNNRQISDTAEHKRKISHEIRQEGRALRNETANKVMYLKISSPFTHNQVYEFLSSV